MKTRKPLWEPAFLIVGMIVLILSFQNCSPAHFPAAQNQTATATTNR